MDPNIWMLRGISLMGLLIFVGLAWSMSEARRRVDWRLVIIALALQFAFGLLVLQTPFGVPFFQAVRGAFDLITSASNEGASFVFGNLTRVFILPEALTPGGWSRTHIFPSPPSSRFRCCRSSFSYRRSRRFCSTWESYKSSCKDSRG